MKNYILIVEDDNDISFMLKDLLLQNGYEVSQAFSGTEALFYIEKEPPMAMILDLMLPGMNGEDLLCKIKKEYPEYDYIVVNDNLDVCVEEVHCLVDAARRAPVRREAFIKEIREELKSFAKGAK